MDTLKICPACKKPLAPDAPMGLCPECLLKSGFPTASGPAANFVPPTVEEIARLFPQLEILGFLGKGGMGAVYKARQPILDRLVALKVLPPDMANDPGFAERFNREARALARLNHPNIVAVYDFGQAGTMPYLLMELIDGVNLREMEQSQRLSPEQALAIVPQICEALQFAHNEGIVHRDIKPENLLIDKKGRVKITDFGIAKIVGAAPSKVSLTGLKDVVGTPHYMAPEQIEKPQTVDHRADIYSLGVVFYEMLTGELPMGKFQAPSQKVHVDVRLDEVVLRTLEKEPERRYQQAGEVKTRVENIASTPPPTPATPSPILPLTPRDDGSDKMILPAFLLAFFFGYCGVHRFYVGKIRTGILQLAALLSWIPIIVAIVHYREDGEPFLGLLLGSVVVGGGIWWTVDWILIICKAFTDAQGRKLIHWARPGPPAPPSSAPPPTPPGVVNKNIIVAPAICLIVAGTLKIFSGLKGLILLNSAMDGFVDSILSNFGLGHLDALSHTARLAILLKLIPIPVILYGGLQMMQLRSYAWSIAAAILGIVFGGFLGIIAGIWSLIVLLREDVRKVFTQTPASAQPFPEWLWVLPVVAIGLVVLSGLIAAIGNFHAFAEGKPAALAPMPISTATNFTGHLTEVGASADFSASREDLGPGGLLTLNVDRGEVRVTGSDQNVFSIHALRRVRRASGIDASNILMEERLVIEKTENNIIITATEPPSLRNDSLWRAFSRPDIEAHYEIVVPRHFATHIETMGGNVNMSDLESNLFAKTMGGNVDLRNLRGDAEGHTMGGDIHARRCTNALTVHTMGGSVTVEEFAGPSLQASTAGGEVSADFLNPPTADSELRTMGGDVTAKLPKNSAIRLDASTMGGSVRTDFTVAVRGKAHESSLQGTINGGGPLLKLKTLGGSIELLSHGG